MVIGEPQKPLLLLFILRPWPVFYIFDISWNAMVRAPVLALPNATDPFILDTDASDKSVRAELIQIQEGEERAVAYGSLTGLELVLSPLHSSIHQMPFPVHLLIDMYVSLLGPEGETPLSYLDSGATKILHHSKGIISNY
jgi:hypothetical protein